MNAEQNERYRDILIAPIKECKNYTPKFGHSSSGGFTLSEFQQLYSADSFYKWLGLDNPLMYSAHKAAGGITSVYRQIGIGSERLVRAIFMDYLGLNETDVTWSYTVSASNGKTRTLSLDGRIILENVQNTAAKERISSWVKEISSSLSLAPQVEQAMTGVVFEVRQGYKSKDSKRQNADISNASNAYANSYIPCLMVMSSQIDDDIVTRYGLAKWAILRGNIGASPLASTYDFFKDIVGFDFVQFMNSNQQYFQEQMHGILEQLMRAE